MIRSPDRIAAVAVAVVAVVYVATASRVVLGGDVGEMATIAVTGGMAHAPGYPLVSAYLHAMRWLPAASPAHAAALANALVACAAAFTLLRACRAWGAGALASAVAVVIWALAPTTWALATEAEVFAANLLFTALILWLAAPAPPLAPARRAVMLALVAGLALANHHTIVALAPLGLLAFVRAVRGSARRGPVIAASAAALALGLAPYGLLFLAETRALDPATWSWGGVHDGASLLANLRRDDYPTSTLTSVGNVVAGVRRVTAALAGLPLLTPIALVVSELGGRRGARDRAPWAALIGCYLLAGPAFATAFHVPLEGVGLVVTERFDLLPITILAPACAVALDRLASPLIARARLSSRATRTALSALALGAVLALAASRGAPALRAHQRPAVEQYVKNALLAAPPRAIIVGTGDQRFGAFLYARYALGLRDDVVFVNPRLLFAPWYRQRIERAVGGPLPEVHDRKLDVVATFEALLATRRPVMVATLFSPAALARFASYPIGPLVRIVVDPREIPPPADLEAQNVALAARFEREPAPPPGPEPWSDALADDYARPFDALAAAFASAGDGARAKVNHERAVSARAGR